MKQLFLPLALLASSFVYSADMNSKAIEPKTITVGQLNLSSEEKTGLKRWAEFRGQEEPKKKAPAFPAFCGLIKTDEKLVLCKTYACAGKKDGDYEWCFWFAKTKDFELEKDKDNFIKPENMVVFVTKKNSVLDQVVSAAWYNAQETFQ